MYRLKEADGELIRGTFFEAELQKAIERSDHLFRIEKILKHRGKGANKEGVGPANYETPYPSCMHTNNCS